MKLNLLEKFLGTSWVNWFVSVLKHNGFTSNGNGSYVNEDQTIEVRVFRAAKNYQVKQGKNLSKPFEFTFPHLTNRLHD